MKLPIGNRLATALLAEFTECKDGEKTTIGIFEYNQDGNHDPMDKIEASVEPVEKVFLKNKG